MREFLHTFFFILYEEIGLIYHACFNESQPLDQAPPARAGRVKGI